MIYLIEHPIGIDKEIQKIQSAIYKNINWGNIQCFGRVQKNPKGEKGFVAESYVGKGEYKDVLFDDKFNATICFIEDETHKVSKLGELSTEVKVVFSVDLNKIFHNNSKRMDSEIEIEAFKLLSKQGMFTIKEIEKEVDTIFKGYDTSKIKTLNMYPYHTFAIIGELKYKINNC
ncbi:hypothetical protein JJC03_09185 [Flavobacterium oreochromis]|uniref:hypothetical protein n=1 Tax=Flavobacterium oreochromis TaxID=2906078 RepID=UPI001CE58971|nr:hypothetical protein [Flavobacterium oreochromis]QYS85412.1 hypothetical protein JJC03_09185 [Flavobacterium oreochromis]